jgi:molybdopterin synthase sulfur carrier subunit
MTRDADVGRAALIRVALPAHLRTLARVDSEVELQVTGLVTQGSVLDALEARYPVLRGTIRDQRTGRRRAFVRFFACEQDLSHEQPDAPLPAAVVAGDEPLLIVGAMAGG